jgi:hypothetical protein
MKKSTMSAVAAVCVAGALAIGLGSVSDWYTNWDTSTWFGRGGGNSSVQPDDPNKPDVGYDTGHDGAIITVGDGNGIRLTSAKLPVSAYAANGVSQYADTAYILTATVSPSDATDTALDWSVAFVEPDSEWATGKTVTDYVTVTPTADGASTAAVECKQAFGAQITVVCKARSNSAVSASCSVDYTQKLLGSKLVFGPYYGGGPSDTFEEGSGVVTITRAAPNHDPYRVGINFGYSQMITSSACTLPDEYTWKITSRGTPVIWDHHYLDGTGLVNGSLECTVYENGVYKSYQGTGGANDYPIFSGAGLGAIYGDAYKSARFYNMLGADEIVNTEGCLLIESTITGKYSTYTYTYKATFVQSNFAINVSDVELDNDSIIF